MIKWKFANYYFWQNIDFAIDISAVVVDRVKTPIHGVWKDFVVDADRATVAEVYTTVKSHDATEDLDEREKLSVSEDDNNTDCIICVGCAGL